MEKGELAIALLCLTKLNGDWPSEEPKAEDYEKKLNKAEEERPKKPSRKGRAAR